MSATPDLTTVYYTTLAPLLSDAPHIDIAPAAAEPNVTSCEQWEEAHHLLFHLGNLSLLAGLVIPTTLALHMILLRVLLMTGMCLAFPTGQMWSMS